MALTLFSPRPLEAGSSKRVLLYSRCTCSHASFGTCFKASSLSDLTLQTGISRSHDCKRVFQVFQTFTFARNDSTEAFATGSSASQHSNVTVRLFESDTRIIERARLRVYTTRMSRDSTRFHAVFTSVVILSVTVGLVSMFLFRCPGKSYLRSRQVTSTQCTQFTLERLDLTFHGGESDGIDLTNFCHTNRQEITLATSSKPYATACTVVQDRLSWSHLDAVPGTHKFGG